MISRVWPLLQLPMHMWFLPPTLSQQTHHSLRLFDKYVRVRVHRLLLIVSDHHFHQPRMQTFYGIRHGVPNSSNFSNSTQLDILFILNCPTGCDTSHSFAGARLPLPHTVMGYKKNNGIGEKNLKKIINQTQLKEPCITVCQFIFNFRRRGSNSRLSFNCKKLLELLK